MTEISSDIIDAVGGDPTARAGLISANQRIDALAVKSKVVGLYTNILNISVPADVDLIDTTGHHIVGVGRATYKRVTVMPTRSPGAWQATDKDGGKWRLVVNGDIHVDQFGAVADCPRPTYDYLGTGFVNSYPLPGGITDLLPALRDAWGGLPILPRTLTQNGAGLTIIHLTNDDPSLCYGCTDTIIPPFAVRLQGNATGNATAQGTCIRFPPNKRGIQINWRGHQFKYGNAVDRDSGYDAGSTYVEGIKFHGGGGTDRSAHGVTRTTYCDFVNCVFQDFAGNGGENVCFTTVPQSDDTFGISSGSRDRGNAVIGAGGYGWNVDGSDVSASSFRDLHLVSSGYGGLKDSGYYNNDYEGLNIHNYGSLGLGGVYDDGIAYALISNTPNAGQAKPKENRYIWYPVYEISAAQPGRYPQWSSTGTYILSLPAYIGGSTRICCYIENYYLPGHTYGYAMVVGGENHWTADSASLLHDGVSNNMTRSRQPLGWEHRFSIPDPVWGGYVQAGFGSDRSSSYEAALFARRQSEGDADLPWVLWGAYNKNYYRMGFGYNSSGFGDTIRVTSNDTSMTLGRAVAMPRYFTTVRFAIGNPENGALARAIFTTDGIPSGTDRARGERGLNISYGIRGVSEYLAMGDGTVQPCGIVGAVPAASIPAVAGAAPTKAEFDALVAALKAANLMQP